MNVRIIFIAGYSAIFLAVIAQTAFHLAPDPTLLEKRRLAPFPTVTRISDVLSQRFMKSFNDYIDDNFGFRKLFIRANNFVDVRFLRTPSNSHIIIGKNNFLFDLADWRSFVHWHSTATEWQIANAASQIKQFQDRLKKGGIEFLLVLGPNKGTIYPEYMPRPRYLLHKQSERQRWGAALGRAGVHYLDPTSLLLTAKQSERMYYKGDHHWTKFGGLLVTRKIVSDLAEMLRVEPPKLQVIGQRPDSWEATGGGSLDELLGVKAARSNMEPIISASGAKLPPGIVIGDSFIRWLYLRDASLSLKQIEKQKPVQRFDEAIGQLRGIRYVVVTYWEADTRAFTDETFWQ